VNREVVRFGDVVRKVMNKVDPVASGIERYVAGEHMDSDDWRVRRSGSVGDGYLGPAFHVHFQPGQVLYGSRRTYLRKVAVADFEGVCANTTFVLEPATERLDPRYLLYVMSTERFHRNSISLSKGSTNPYINFSDIAPYEFELPSLDEQHRAVELLSAIDTHVEYLVDFQKSASLRKMVFIRDFFQRSVASGNAVRLGDVADVLDHLRRPISATERAKRAGIVPYYGATGRTGWIDEAIFDEELVLLGEDAIDFVSANSQKAYLVAGPSWVNNHAHVLRARRESVDPIFLTEVLNSVDYRPFVSFGTRSKLTQREMLKISFILPSLADQRVFVETLSSMDQQLVCASTAIHSSRGLRMALLNGGLRQ